jgi:hypothetical protein
LFLLNFYALGWVGMWCLVKAPDPKKAHAVGFFLLMVFPGMMFGLIVSGAQFLSWLTGWRFSLIPEWLLLPLLFVIAFANCIYWLLRAKRELPDQLRLFAFRRFMAERSIYTVVVVLTLAGTVLSLPQIGMFYGVHEWTAARTGGVVDARFIAMVDTALESPLGQIAMVPMLAWIANSAPDKLKATYFAVMASFTNLALSLSQLGTKYLNQAYYVAREVKEQSSGAVKLPADYSQLGELLIVQMLIGLALPIAAIVFARVTRFKSA